MQPYVCKAWLSKEKAFSKLREFIFYSYWLLKHRSSRKEITTSSWAIWLEEWERLSILGLKCPWEILYWILMNVTLVATVCRRLKNLAWTSRSFHVTWLWFLFPAPHSPIYFQTWAHTFMCVSTHVEVYTGTWICTDTTTERHRDCVVQKMKIFPI